MTYLGTRPPTLDEWNKYELHHRARLAIKPGITGMWQTRGRSDIDYPERVQMDNWYVHNWNVWLDLVLLWRTVTVVLNHKGAY